MSNGIENGAEAANTGTVWARCITEGTAENRFPLLVTAEADLQVLRKN